MDIRPILSTLRRHKTAAALIVIEIALSCAIICNAVFLIGERVQRIDMASGVADDAIVDIHLAGIGEDQNANALTTEDLAALRGIPGVVSASVANQVPFNSSSWNTSLGIKPDDRGIDGPNATMYMGSESLRDTLGVRLVAGRDLDPAEYVDFDPEAGFGNLKLHSVVVTQSLAKKLFPDGDAIGRNIYFGDNKPIAIVGIVDTLVRPSFFGESAGYGYSMLLPIRVPYTAGGHYLLRTTPGQRDRVIADAVKALERNNPNRIILDRKTLQSMRDDFFRQDRSMVWLLAAVCIALLVVTALGIVGLASFWVQQRTRQIGVRRALGATRGQILRYFQIENFLLATIGIVFGMMLAYGINQLLMGKYELPRLPAIYLPVGAVVLWLLGQLAVFGPASRAAAVPPAVATRTV